MSHRRQAGGIDPTRVGDNHVVQLSDKRLECPCLLGRGQKHLLIFPAARYLVEMQVALADTPLDEFVQDPLLAVACVLLIAVSIAWIIVMRLIVHNYRRAVLRGIQTRTGPVQAPRDIWSIPP